jgi:hypothetical protein
MAFAQQAEFSRLSHNVIDKNLLLMMQLSNILLLQSRATDQSGTYRLVDSPLPRLHI